MQRTLFLFFGLAAAGVPGRTAADETPAKAPAAETQLPSWEVPYRLTKTEHVAVRVRSGSAFTVVIMLRVMSAELGGVSLPSEPHRVVTSRGA